MSIATALKRRLIPSRRGWQRTGVGDWALRQWTARLARQYAGALADARLYCGFIGHGRSSHSLIAAMLDAHPDAAVADELDIVRLVERGYGRGQLLAYCVESARRHAAAGRKKGQQRGTAYSYAVPDQWQGRYKTLSVVGEAALLTARYHDDPELPQRFEAFLELPIRYVQVVRNPFDAISRLHLITGQPVETMALHYFRVCERVAVFRAQNPALPVLVLRNEALIADPAGTVRQLFDYFDLDVLDDTVSACASIVFQSPHRVRDRVTWAPSAVASVTAAIAQYDFLAGYQFE